MTLRLAYFDSLTRVALGAALGLSVTTFACGSSGAGASGDGSGGGPDASEGGADASPPDGGGSAYQGFIQLDTQKVQGQDFYGYSIYLMESTPGGASCYWGDPHGACCLGPGTRAIPGHLSAGPLTLTNNTTGDSGTIGWLADESDYGYLSPAFPWTVGDSLTVSAAGDVVGPFTATATYPSPIEDLDAPTDVSLSGGWIIHWTPAGASEIEVSVNDGTHQLACHADDSAGQLTVPSELLTQAFGGGADSATAVITRRGIGTASENPAIALEGELSVSSPVSLEP